MNGLRDVAAAKRDMHTADPHSPPFSYTIDSSFDAVRDRVPLDAEENPAKFIGGLAVMRQTKPYLSYAGENALCIQLIALLT